MKSANIIRSARATPLAAALILAGCALAPPAKPPAPPAPDHYAAQPVPADSAKADGVTQHFSLGARAVPEWWRLYGNDTLDAWVDRKSVV